MEESRLGREIDRIEGRVMMVTGSGGSEGHAEKAPRTNLNETYSMADSATDTTAKEQTKVVKHRRGDEKTKKFVDRREAKPTTARPKGQAHLLPLRKYVDAPTPSLSFVRCSNVSK
ncbi:hypothetical protein F2Q68_00008699 [Brassica cretica]|uniref:Uncharacterized protein n=1 Tax=Brassica cretica TaxID=69181 RepID=A0A8S9KRF7_BRACR|nr:hypothetical protein F2Q68_00008699 [Brassica cretica]